MFLVCVRYMINEQRSVRFGNDRRDGLDGEIFFAQFLIVQHFFSIAIKNHNTMSEINRLNVNAKP